MYQIGIVSRNSRRLLQIQSQLDQSFILTPRAHLWADKVVQELKKKELQGIILCLETIGQKQVRLVEMFSELFNNMPLLVVGELVGPSSKKRIQNMGINVVVKSADEIDQVAGIMEKMIRGLKVKDRMFDRYTAKTAISVQSGSINRLVLGSGSMENLGFGGLRARVFGKKYQVGDVCTVEIPGGVIGKSRRVSATVRWTRNIKGDLDGGLPNQLVGFSF